MEYYLLKGHFHVVRYAPDGDSLMFEAQNPKDWDKINTKHRKIFEEKLEDGKGSVQLRLQGIDALETHYSPGMMPPPTDMRGKTFAKAEKPKAGSYRQPDKFGDAATKKLLQYLGVKSVNWGSTFNVKWIKSVEMEDGTTYSEKGEDRLKGYVIVNDMDRKGRPIAWVFPGNTSHKNGAKISTTQMLDQIKQAVNYKLVANGMVYPYFFMTLEAMLREPLIHGVLNAQRQKMGLWSDDITQEGIHLNRFSMLTDKHLIFPYFFRRMVKHQFKRQMEAYWEAVKKKKSFTVDPENLYLDSFFDDTNPYVLLVEERDFVRLNEIAHVTPTKIKLNTHPGNMVFLS